MDGNARALKEVVFTVFCPFGGLGAGALGFSQARVELPNLGLSARFELLGGVDIDAEACADFEYLTGVRQHCGDVSCMRPADLRAACPKRPTAVLITAPCTGGSGLLPPERAQEEHYQDLNQLALRFVRLMLATWGDDLPELVLFENVPGLVGRAEAMVAEVRRLLRLAGYTLHEGTHDCGEIADDLPQRRRRWLLVGRLAKKLPEFLRIPPRNKPKPVRTVLEALPLPNDPSAGTMHRLPNIDIVTWVRLALIPAGGDWQDLPAQVWLPEELAANLKAPTRKRPLFSNVFRVVHADAPASPVTGAVQPGSGALSVADPRTTKDGAKRFNNVYAVVPAEESAPAVNGGVGPSSGAASVCDPRVTCTPHPHTYGVVAADESAHTVTGKACVGTGPFSVQDARPTARWHRGVLGVQTGDDASCAITGNGRPGAGAFSLADARLTCTPRKTSGAYGVIPADAHAWTVTGAACLDNGRFSVADTRDPRAPFIIALDGTWHRPFTTLELALIQGLPARVRGEALQLAGRSNGRWRQRIGNAVPVGAARAIARQMLLTLLYNVAGAFVLSSNPIWVDAGDDPRELELASLFALRAITPAPRRRGSRVEIDWTDATWSTSAGVRQ